MKSANPRPAFTLTEVILAIALTAVVVYLITTAIELYVVSVDSSRTRVESAQLARALLDQIADDFASARLTAPAAGTAFASGSGQPAGGGDQGSAGFGTGASTGAGFGAAGGTSPGATPPPTMATVQGVYGTADVVRIDRLPLANWERTARQVEVQETSSAADLPVSVRYFFIDAKRMSPEQLAQRGLSAVDVQDTSVAGLYRESQPTVAVAAQGDATVPASGAASPDAAVELLAPEVASFALSYFDGQDFVEEWDAVRDGGLPRGVEIRLTLVEPQFHAGVDAERTQRRSEGRYEPGELVEYRRFVHLPRVDPSPPAQALLPASASNQPGNPAQSGGQPGQPGQPNQAGAAAPAQNAP